MIIGLPKEIKDQEHRVALLPSGACQLIKPAIIGGINIMDGKITHRAVAEAHGLPFTPADV